MNKEHKIGDVVISPGQFIYIVIMDSKGYARLVCINNYESYEITLVKRRLKSLIKYEIQS